MFSVTSHMSHSCPHVSFLPHLFIFHFLWVSCTKCINTSLRIGLSQEVLCSLQAMKYLSYLLYPLCIGGAVYSLLNIKYKRYGHHQDSLCHAVTWRAQSITDSHADHAPSASVCVCPPLHCHHRLGSVAPSPHCGKPGVRNTCGSSFRIGDIAGVGCPLAPFFCISRHIVRSAPIALVFGVRSDAFDKGKSGTVCSCCIRVRRSLGKGWGMDAALRVRVFPSDWQF